MNTKKMMKATVNLDMILNVVQKIFAVGAVIFLACAILMLVCGDRIIPHMDVSLELGELSLSPNNLSQVVDISAFKVYLMFILVAATVLLAILWYEIRLIRKLLAPIKEGRPFNNGVSKTVRHLAWVILIGGAIDALFEVISVVIETRAIDFTALFNTETISGFSVNYPISCVFIVETLIIFVLSYIFQYGEELQKESDETL